MPVSAWNRFCGAAMKRGMSMKAAASAWRAHKGGHVKVHHHRRRRCVGGRMRHRRRM